MKTAAAISKVFLLLLALVSASAGFLAPYDYQQQFREEIESPPSKQFLLGTDELGRDRFSRLLYGTRVSVLLAPAAAALSVLLAFLAGAAAALLRGFWEWLLLAMNDLFLSLPWLFLLLTVRAALPLNVAPFASIVITFLLLGLLGWAGPARVVHAEVLGLARSDFVLQARAQGIGAGRLLVRHLAPNLAPVLSAQFWISVPVLILAEANLGMLGLGVAEPLPSWGSLFRELRSPLVVEDSPWTLVPVLLLMLAVLSMQAAYSPKEIES